jgi:hypothetical protein
LKSISLSFHGVCCIAVGGTPLLHRSWLVVRVGMLCCIVVGGGLRTNLTLARFSHFFAKNSTFIGSVRGHCYHFLVRGAWSIFRPSSLELGGVGIYNSEDCRLFSNLSQISTTLEHGFYVRARRTSTGPSTKRWVMTIEVKLNTRWPMHSKADGLSASRN